MDQMKAAVKNGDGKKGERKRRLKWKLGINTGEEEGLNRRRKRAQRKNPSANDLLQETKGTKEELIRLDLGFWISISEC
jgi:hypothetical protein